MGANLIAPLNWRGTTGRAAYLAWGLGLMVLKYNLDRLLAWKLAHIGWNWASYWRPVTSPLSAMAAPERQLLFWLLIAALPFIGAGVILTVRRLRDSQWPLWLVCLFFVPGLNLIFFAWLALTPSRATPPVLGQADHWSGWLAFADPRASALAGLVLTVLLAVVLVAFGTSLLANYGWGIFVGLPFFMGLVSTLVHSAAQQRTWRSCCIVAMLSVLFAGLALLALAIEGLICILMAAPLALPLAVLGASVGYRIQLTRWSHADTARLYGVAWLVLPVLLYGESRTVTSPPLIAATTSVVINAPPEVVWRHVVTFSELPPPQEWIFHSGIAYPVRARIWGHGVGAVRHCEFSTGPFVEPITVWDEPRRLAFDVTVQPPPMSELSPYRDIDSPHLHGFFQSRRGQFLLTALPDGRTRLEGTTWYDQNLWPNRYWRVWSDYLVHRIHSRVLEHIKIEAEAEPKA